MLHVWGLLGGLGLLLFVISGTWACLNAGTSDPSGDTAGKVAVAGLGLVLVSLIARREGRKSLRWVGRVMGAVGILVTSIAGVITVLAVAVAPGMLPNLLMITAAGLTGWAVGASLEADVAFTQSLLWLAAFVIVGAAAIAGVLVLTTLGRAAGIDNDWATRLALLVTSFVVAVVSAAWARGRPDRGAAPMAIARLAIGRPNPDDRALLARGPASLLQRRPLEPGTPAAPD